MAAGAAGGTPVAQPPIRRGGAVMGASARPQAKAVGVGASLAGEAGGASLGGEAGPRAPAGTGTRRGDGGRGKRGEWAVGPRREGRPPTGTEGPPGGGRGAAQAVAGAKEEGARGGGKGEGVRKGRGRGRPGPREGPGRRH